MYNPGEDSERMKDQNLLVSDRGEESFEPDLEEERELEWWRGHTETEGGAMEKIGVKQTIRIDNKKDAVSM